MSLRDLLFRPEPGLGLDGGDVAVHAGDETCTWAGLRDRAGDVACALADAGVRAGQPVGVMLPNGIDLVAALFGVWRADAVYVPLNPRLTAPEVDRTLATVGPAAVVTTPDHAPRFAGLPVLVPDAAGGTSWRLVRTGEPGVVRTGFDPGVALVQFTSGTTGVPKPVLLEHDGVLRLLDGVVAKLRGGAGARPAVEPPGQETAGSTTGGARRAPMANLIPVSLSLWAGIYNVLFAFRVGAPVVVMDGFDPAEFGALVRRHGIRSTVLPPAAMTALVDDEGITDLAPLRMVRSITAPLSPLQARRFKDRFGIAVLNSYGQTELGGEIVGWNAADARRHGDAKLGAVGRPHAGVELRIVDPTHGELADPAVASGSPDPAVVARAADPADASGSADPAVDARAADPADAGESADASRPARPADVAETSEAAGPGETAAAAESVDSAGAAGAAEAGDSAGAAGAAEAGDSAGVAGELWVRTPAVAAGYADGSGLGDRLSGDGWFRTGDIARIDADGFLWIEGRVSDMVNRGGLKVHPAEVEEVLRLAPSVADTAVVGVPDERLGEVPWAFVVPDPGGPFDPEALAALCRAHLAPYKVPVRFETIDALPRNEVGKVLRRALAQEAANR